MRKRSNSFNCPDECPPTKQRILSETKQISSSCPKMESLTRQKTIHVLSDANLENIFAMLPLVDRVAVQTVCKRWNTIVKKSWRTSASKKLELPRPNIDFETISYVLFASGPHLTHIDFSQNAGDIDEIILYSININCKNVRCMDLSSMKLSPTGAKYLKTNFKNITEFAFVPCTKDYNQHLSSLFDENNKMKSLKIESISSDLEFLIESPISETLEELVLENINSDFSSFCQAADKYKNLNKLLIKDCDNITEEIVETITTNWKNIKHLQFSGNFNKIKSLNAISFLKHLQTLDISFNILVDDILLKRIVDECPDLYDLNISGCDLITTDGLKTVSTLPKLKILYINYLTKIQEFHFNKMENLEILSCCGCTNLTNEYTACIVNDSIKLKFLDVSYCKQITKAMTFKTTNIEMPPEVRQSEMLEINIYGSGIAVNTDINLEYVRFIRRKETKSRISIDILNDDCLKHVFSYLPLEDRLSVGKVCNRWSYFNEEFYDKIQALCPIALKQEIISLEVLNHLLNRCRRQILHVDFSVFGKHLSCKHIKLVLSKCRKLHSIVFPDKGLLVLMRMIFGKSNDDKLYDAFTNSRIREFYYRYRRSDVPCVSSDSVQNITVESNYLESSLHILFIYFPHIKYFKIEDSKFIGDSLFTLPFPKLESLIVKDCWGIYTSDFDLAITRFTNLKHLSITGCSRDTSDLTLSIRSATITSLQISNNQPNIDFNFEELPNLHSLDVSKSEYVDNAMLQRFCKKYNNLTKLDISSCSNISTEGLKVLRSLKKLEHLSMNDLQILDFQAEGLRKLKILECRDCLNLQNAGFFELLNMSPALEKLDLTNCVNITHHLINHLISSFRGSSQVFEIHVGGTSVTKDEIQDCGRFNVIRIKF